MLEAELRYWTDVFTDHVTMPNPVFIANYEVCGPNLDVDELLLKVVQPKGSTVWRRGDVTAFGPDPASGLRVPIYRGDSVTELDRAIEAFLLREEPLILMARRLAGPVRGFDTQDTLSTSVFVAPGDPPVGVTFSATLLGVAGRLGIALDILACSWERKDATE